MKRLIQFIHDSVKGAKVSTQDPIQAFFTGGETKEKRFLYEKALRAADLDQKKVIEAYNKKVAL